MSKLTFSITGEYITKVARDMFKDDAKKAYDFLKESFTGMTREHIFPILLGTKKLTGVNNVLFEDDNELVDLHYMKKRFEKKIEELHDYNYAIQDNFNKYNLDEKELYRDISLKNSDEISKIKNNLQFLTDNNIIKNVTYSITYEDFIKRENKKTWNEEKQRILFHKKPRPVEKVIDYWIEPDGTGWNCSGPKSGNFHYNLLCDLQEYEIYDFPNKLNIERQVEELNWIKISEDKLCYFPESHKHDSKSVVAAMTQEQRRFLIDYLELHGKESISQKFYDSVITIEDLMGI